MRKLLALWLLLALPAFGGEGPPVTPPGQVQDSRQAVVVLTDSWQSTRGQLLRYERDAGGAWSQVGGQIPVTVGRKGLAWGRGLHPEEASLGRVKREGDGCAPAGIFRLSQLFGHGQPEPPAGALPYLEVSGSTAGVDDPDSRYYNRIVTPGPGVIKDWRSAERMRIPDYRIGILVDHNTPAVKGAGSCIFMHLWVSPDVPTAGCTATTYSNMRMLADWLRRDAQPVLIQLPREEYRRYRETWGLP